MPDETSAEIKRPSRLTSPSNIKKFALARRELLRPAWTTSQVAKSLTDEAELHLRNWLDDRIRSHPTKGQTIR